MMLFASLEGSALLREGFALAAECPDPMPAREWLARLSEFEHRLDDPVLFVLLIDQAVAAYIADTGRCPYCGHDPETHEPDDF